MKYQHLFPRSNCTGYCRVSRMQKALCGEFSREVTSLFFGISWEAAKEVETLHEFKTCITWYPGLGAFSYNHINNTRENPHSASASPTYVSICKGFCRAGLWLVESKSFKSQFFAFTKRVHLNQTHFWSVLTILFWTYLIRDKYSHKVTLSPPFGSPYLHSIVLIFCRSQLLTIDYLCLEMLIVFKIFLVIALEQGVQMRLKIITASSVCAVLLSIPHTYTK